MNVAKQIVEPDFQLTCPIEKLIRDCVQQFDRGFKDENTRLKLWKYWYSYLIANYDSSAVVKEGKCYKEN